MKRAEDSVNVRWDSLLVSDDVIVDGGDLRNTKRTSFSSAFPMSVPSLSW